MIPRRSLLAGSALLLAPKARAATIDPPCGPLAGVAAAGVQAFMGVPYAAPPLGPLRYASPRPAPRWTETRDATRPGPAPIQTLGGAAAWLYEPTHAQSEDCLTLNVWTPGPAGRRPVMVWFHGGAWRTGNGAVAGTDGAALARNGGVVVVTVNYRLGALGWLAHPQLADPATGAAANWGLQDQVAALRWVQANIAAFGGDPARVTVFGQSAGGSSAASIVQDPRNADLAHRAIVQSGSLHGAPGFPEMATAAAYAEALAKRLDTDIPGLRTIPAATLHQAELTLARDPAMARALGRPPVLPVRDGVVLQAWPRDAAMAPIPLLIGTTATEGTFWFDLVTPDGAPVPGLKPPATMDELRRAVPDLAAIYRPEATHTGGIADAYAAAALSRGASTTPKDLWVAIYTDAVFRLRARTAAARHAATAPTWLYEFARPLAPPGHGVPHTAEIPFAFGTFADPFFAAKVGGPGAAELSAGMLAAWARFAHDGDPGPGWARSTADALPVNVLGAPGAWLQPRDHVRAEELAAWDAA